MSLKFVGTSELPRMSAEEVDDDDLLLISDSVDKNGNAWPTTKSISVKELRRLLTNPNCQIKWKCLRCGSLVDMDKFRCKCEKSPSPWEKV